MRLVVGTALIVLAAEVILAAAFIIGYFAVGGWLPGLLLMLGVLVLMVIPWIGDLAVDFNLADKRTNVKLAWWGRATVEQKHEPKLSVRVLGIPYSKEMRRKMVSKEPEKPKLFTVARVVGWVEGHMRTVGWFLLMGGTSAHMMFWEAKEFKVKLWSATENRILDHILARIIKARKIGNMSLYYMIGNKRQAEVHYQIGLFRAAVAGLYTLLQGQPTEVAKSWAAANKAADQAERETARELELEKTRPRPELRVIVAQGQAKSVDVTPEEEERRYRAAS